MDISDKVCLIVGGGKIALHKVKVLLQFNIKIHLVAPEICKEIYTLKNSAYETDLNIIKREFCQEDILQADIVIAATDNHELNRYIANLCKNNNKLVNVVDDKEQSNFIFPAIIKKKDLLLTISTGGKSPMFTVVIKEELEKHIPEYYGDLIDILGEVREYIKEFVPDGNMRKKIYMKLIACGKEAGRGLEQKEIEEIIGGLKEL
jgi:siroheme synthase-like protein